MMGMLFGGGPAMPPPPPAPPPAANPATMANGNLAGVTAQSQRARAGAAAGATVTNDGGQQGTAKASTAPKTLLGQ